MKADRLQRKEHAASAFNRTVVGIGCANGMLAGLFFLALGGVARAHSAQLQRACLSVSWIGCACFRLHPPQGGMPCSHTLQPLFHGFVCKVKGSAYFLHPLVAPVAPTATRERVVPCIAVRCHCCCRDAAAAAVAAAAAAAAAAAVGSNKS